MFLREKQIHVMMTNEAQGVEFDVVFLVGINEDTFSISFGESVSEDLAREKKRINKDLLYVALTRAISELYVFGKKKLKEVI